jgi:outer membrane protein assembly factor BamB
MNKLLTFALLLTIAPTFADWPQWRGLNRDGLDGHSPALIAELPKDGLKPLWLNRDVIAKGRGESWSSPVVAGDKVYFFTHARAKDDQREEHVFCLAAQDGEEVWHKTFPSRATKVQLSGTPAVADGRLYYLGAGPVLRCLNAESGDELWVRKLSSESSDEPWHGSPVVSDGVVLVFAHRLFGLSANDGEVLWQGDDVAKEGVHGSPAVAILPAGPLAIAHIGQGATIAVEPRSGKEHWRVKSEAVASSPVVHGDLLLTLGNSRKGGLRCYRMSSDSAELLWNYQQIADPGASPVVVGDYVYVQGEKRLACVSLEDGKAAWTSGLDVKEPRYTSLMAADGQVFYVFDSLMSFAAQPDKCEPLYRGYFDKDGDVAAEPTKDNGPYSCTSPAISHGRMIVRLKQGLAAYDLRK